MLVVRFFTELIKERLNFSKILLHNKTETFHIMKQRIYVLNNNKFSDLLLMTITEAILPDTKSSVLK